jgi:hypothetical protein
MEQRKDLHLSRLYRQIVNYIRTGKQQRMGGSRLARCCRHRHCGCGWCGSHRASLTF